MPQLTPEIHARQIANSLKRETVAKYLKGQAEHKGHLWEVPVPIIMDFAIEEAIDQGVYLKTMQQQVKLLIEWMSELLAIIENPREEPLGIDEKVLISDIKDILGL